VSKRSTARGVVLFLVAGALLAPPLLLTLAWGVGWAMRRRTTPTGIDRVEATKAGPATNLYWTNMCCAFGLGHDVLYAVRDASSKADEPMARDGKVETAWLSPGGDCGAGSALEFSAFRSDSQDILDSIFPQTYRLGGLVIAGGWPRDEKTWRAHARPKRLRVLLDEQPIAEVGLEDVMATQWAGFRFRFLAERSQVRVEILETYCGEDPSLPLAISEIDLTPIPPGRQ